jgi:hypothetical protein
VSVELDQGVEVAVLPQTCEVWVLQVRKRTLELSRSCWADYDNRSGIEQKSSSYLAVLGTSQLQQLLLQRMESLYLSRRQLIFWDEVRFALE